MEIFASYANEFLAKFERISKIIKHGPSIGTYHENIVRNFMSDFLTSRFSVKTGFIYDGTNELASKQIDVGLTQDTYEQMEL